MPPVDLSASVATLRAAGRAVTTVTLSNPSAGVALLAHVSLRNDATGQRALPVLDDDNHVTLLPGESRTITADSAAADRFAAHVDGFNVVERTTREPGR
jgi:hypothetical protein